MVFKLACQDIDCAASGQGLAPCVVASQKYCFNGQGSQDDLNNAWNILILIARYRILRIVLEETYSFTLVPVRFVLFSTDADFSADS